MTTCDASAPQILGLLVLDHAIELSGQPVLRPVEVKVAGKSAGIPDFRLQHAVALKPARCMKARLKRLPR